MQPFRGLSRREFLKLISLVPVGIYSRPIQKLSGAAGSAPNVILIVFDAWSQHHVSLYGYPRPTTPHLENFARHATVYHNHYSAGTFTVPGTSSLLTGLYPWTHRAFQLGGGLSAAHAAQTLFSVLSSSHSTLAYTQNKFADQILNQANASLDEHVPHWSFNREYNSLYGAHIFRRDPRMAFASIEDNLVQKGEGTDTSLFFGPLYRLHMLKVRQQDSDRFGNDYPLGLPDAASEAFLLPDVVEGAIELLKSLQQPALVYLHFYPPHEPYTPTAEFYDRYRDDGLSLPYKPMHEIAEKRLDSYILQKQHRFYDEYIASWDREVARLFQYLQESGLADNSYIFLTSDHGELFERGELGHWTRIIYDPLIHVPLIVWKPGQSAREDVFTTTSSVDLMPTIANLTGNPIPDWAEGRLLPRLGGEEEESRGVFSMDAKTNSSFGPLRNYSMALTREKRRLVHYIYPRDRFEKYEFYDLEDDPREMTDLYPANPSLARQMQDELLQKVLDANRPFDRA